MLSLTTPFIPKRRIKIFRGKQADQVERDFARFMDECQACVATQTHYDAGEIVVIVFYEVAE